MPPEGAGIAAQHRHAGGAQHQAGHQRAALGSDETRERDEHQQQQGRQPGAQAQQALHVPGRLRPRHRGGRKLRHRRAGIGRVHRVAGRCAGRFGIRGGQGGRGIVAQAAQPAGRQDSLGHQQRGQWQGSPDARLQSPQPFAHHAQRDADDARGQHGQDDQVAPAPLIVKAQAQGGGHPGDAVVGAQPAQDEVAEHQGQHQHADGDRGQDAGAEDRAGAPAACRQFPAQQQEQVQGGHEQTGHAGPVEDYQPVEYPFAQPQGRRQIQDQRPQQPDGLAARGQRPGQQQQRPPGEQFPGVGAGLVSLAQKREQGAQQDAGQRQQRAGYAAPHPGTVPQAQTGPGGGQRTDGQKPLRPGETLHFGHVLPVGGNPADRGAAQQQNA
ncbi:hypothetical protein D3C72_1253210 [compost metagenome]